MGKLTVAKIAMLTEPGRHGDGGGLWLQISKWKTKSWVLRYWRGGKERNYGLGPLSLVPLADARRRAIQIRQRIYFDGIDPVDQRRAARAAARRERSRQVSFGKCALDYIEAHKDSWRSPKHQAQWRALEKECRAIWTLPVGEVDVEQVLRVLQPIWKTKNVTATRVRSRIELVLAYATGRKLREGENPARWSGHLETMLAAPTKVAKVEHHAAVPVADVPALAAKLRARSDVAAKAVEIILLTALRSAEVTGAKWSEIDFGSKVWTIDGSRMKSGREHRVPLSERAIAVFKSIRPMAGSDLVFDGIGVGLNARSPLAAMKEVAGAGSTIHGLRSSFRDWAGERTNFPRDLIEEALAHRVGDKTERAYKRSDLLEKRRKLMEQWARYCASTPKVGGAVVELRQA
jgi:integrase